MDRNTLLVKALQGGDENALESLLSQNDRLVWSVVQHMTQTGFEKEDLFQVGCIGLIKAAKRFDISRNLAFSTYAVHMIIGEIKRYMRDDGIIKVSRSLKELSYKIKKASNEYIKNTGNEPTVTYLAEILNKSEAEIIEGMESSRLPFSINQPVGNECGVALADKIAVEGSFDEKVLDAVSLEEAVKTLEKREKFILYMRYYNNKTQAEVAEKLGISQVHVSRLEKKILEKLRKEIAAC